VRAFREGPHPPFGDPLPQLFKIPLCSSRSAEGGFDLSQLTDFTEDAVEIAVSVLKRENVHVERSAVLVNKKSKQGLKVWRMLQMAQNRRRLIVKEVDEAQGWLAELATEVEAAAIQRYIKGEL
jgi:hypothetical protein